MIWWIHNIHHLLWEYQFQTTSIWKNNKESYTKRFKKCFCFLLNIKYWKTFGEYKYYLKKSTQTSRKSNRKTTYFSAVSFNKLKPFSFILSLFTLINLLHKTQFLLFLSPRWDSEDIAFPLSKANFLFTILNFLRRQILNYCIQRKTTLIIEK